MADTMLNRLTKYEVIDGTKRPVLAPDCNENDAVSLLASYEDTGLSPDTISQIVRATEYMMFPNVGDFVRYAIANFEELEKYRRDEREGRLLRPVCKMEGQAYWVNFYRHEVMPLRVVSINFIGNETVEYGCWGDGYAPARFHGWDIGKTVFLSREEAEKVLEKQSPRQNPAPCPPLGL